MVRALGRKQSGAAGAPPAGRAVARGRSTRTPASGPARPVTEDLGPHAAAPPLLMNRGFPHGASSTSMGGEMVGGSPTVMGGVGSGVAPV